MLSDDTDLLLSSGKLTLAFALCEGRLNLKGFARAGGCEWLNEGPGELWKIEFLSPDGEKFELAGDEASLADIASIPPALKFTWTVRLRDETASVVVTVRLDKDDSLSYWSLEADLPDAWRIVRADFPITSNIKLRENLKLAAPNGWGMEYAMAPGVGYDGIYPSCAAAMQFVALYDRHEGIYIGAHDPKANHKRFRVQAEESGVAFTLVNYPSIPKDHHTFRLPFEVAIGVFIGDYYDAAQIYREFTYTTRWGRAGPVSKRPIPQWVKATDLWLRPDGSPEDNVEVTRRALKYFGVTTSLHWYRWHVIPYDTLYPEYFPPLPGFVEGVQALQSEGAHVMPYINGRLCDPNSATWNDEGGSKWAALQEDGEPYTEVYGSKVPLNVMCPFTEEWQSKIAGIVDRLIRECGVDGVYIDQIAAAYAVQCFDPSHGHSIGGGSFWVEGYRKMLDRVRTLLPEDRMITSEENAECWIDQFDALLLVNTHTDHPPIPLFPAVYSGRTINFGFMYLPADDLERSLPFRVKMGRGFLWGTQIGWIQPARIMAPDAVNEAEFLRNLARCRRFGHEFFTFGRFLGPVDARGDFPQLKGVATGSFGGEYEIDVPAVMACAWQSEAGDLAVALVNLSDRRESVSIEFPLEKAGLDPAEESFVDLYDPEGLCSPAKLRSTSARIEVAQRSAVIAVVRN